jgi:hypothetical protein
MEIKNKGVKPEFLDYKQYNLVQGFFAHLWAVRWNKGKKEFDAWAKILDEAKISWYVQNSISAIADKRESAFLYLRNQLEAKQIYIIN